MDAGKDSKQTRFYVRRKWPIGALSALILIGLISLLAPKLSHFKAREDRHSANDGYWPGMLLFGRDGRPSIHVFSNGRRESGVGSLIGYLHHEDAGIRTSAADWLGAIGPSAKDAVPSLKKALDDPDEKVRTAAAEALQKIE
jgi:hypothetical protein